MDQFTDNLDSGDKIIWEGKPVKEPFIKRMSSHYTILAIVIAIFANFFLFFIGIIFFGLFSMLALPFTKLSPLFLFLPFLLVLVAAIAVAVFELYLGKKFVSDQSVRSYENIGYALTDKHVMIRDGVGNIMKVPYGNVAKVEANDSEEDKTFKTGSLKITTDMKVTKSYTSHHLHGKHHHHLHSYTTNAVYTIDNIKHPDYVIKNIDSRKKTADIDPGDQVGEKTDT